MTGRVSPFLLRVQILREALAALRAEESRGEAFCWRTKEQQEEVPLRLEAAPLSDGFFMFAPASEETARSERLRAVTARCQT